MHVYIYKVKCVGVDHIKRTADNKLYSLQSFNGPDRPVIDGPCTSVGLGPILSH